MKWYGKPIWLCVLSFAMALGLVQASDALVEFAARQEQKRLEVVQLQYRMSPIAFFAQNKSRAAGRRFSPYTKTILNEMTVFPVDGSYRERIAYEDSFGAGRTFGGTRIHEGCDLMDTADRRGEIPVVSMTSGVVAKLGWLRLGGYRVGILSDGGIYYYYAHLDGYMKGLKVGDRVCAGQPIGFMGDTGYGEEKTVGQFAVHLHVGIYFYDEENSEISINPYPFLQRLDMTKNVTKKRNYL